MVALYAAGLGMAIAAAVWSADLVLTALSGHASKLASARGGVVRQPPVVARERRVLDSDDEWMQSVRREVARQSERPRGLGVSGEPAQEEHSGPHFSGTLRTVCVRLCDGFSWPISFSTSRASLGHDRQVCESSCTSPARLYVNSSPDGDMQGLVDLNGRPYSALPTAYFFQASYDESCKCRPHPWEKEARDRHRTYALQSRIRKGDRKAAEELRILEASAPPAGRSGPRIAKRGPGEQR